MKSFIFLFAAVTLVALGFVSRRPPDAPTEKAPNPVLEIRQQSDFPPTLSTLQNEVIIPGEDMRAASHDSMSRVASAMTPKIRQMMVDGLMRSREPRYKKLFEEWKLDKETASKVLEVVRVRETKIKEEFQKFYSIGVKGREDFFENYAMEKNVAEIQIRLLLGDDCFEEFSLLESQMVAELQAGGQRILTSD